MSIDILLEKSERALSIQSSIEHIDETLKFFKHSKNLTIEIDTRPPPFNYHVSLAFQSGDVAQKVTKYMLTQLRKRKKELQEELEKMAK